MKAIKSSAEHHFLKQTPEFIFFNSSSNVTDRFPEQFFFIKIKRLSKILVQGFIMSLFGCNIVKFLAIVKLCLRNLPLTAQKSIIIISFYKI